MWIRNKVTGTLQEIHNADVIKVCKKEPDKYELSEEYPGNNEKMKAAAQAAAAQAAAEKKAAEEAEKAAKEAEEKAKAEEAAKAAEEAAAQAAAQAAAGGEGAGTNAGAVNYEEMKLNDLRKIAKEKGIQGYNNMDKATLIAVIQAH